MDNADKRLSIKEWAEEDRPREKMLLKGVSLLSDAELIAILISSGNNEETSVQLSQRILNSVSNNLNTLGKLSIKKLMEYKGIGEAKAVAISAAMELGRRKAVAEPEKRISIHSSKDSYLLFYPLLCDLPYEELWVALTNRNGKVIEKVKISQGGISGTTADFRLIIKAAIDCTCSGVVLCHNHPSGNQQPSAEDDALTSRLGKAVQLIDIKLLDHIIICDNYYYSYADEGRL